MTIKNKCIKISVASNSSVRLAITCHLHGLSNQHASRDHQSRALLQYPLGSEVHKSDDYDIKVAGSNCTLHTQTHKYFHPQTCRSGCICSCSGSIVMAKYAGFKGGRPDIGRPATPSSSALESKEWSYDVL